MRRLLVIALVLFVVLLPGCRIGRAVVRSTGALLSSPEHVQKVENPVRKDARLAVLWVGHATALVQMDDKFVLTDPIFTSSAGQLSKRLVEPGIEPDKLPPLDAVVVSHMHFDHLSLGSLDMIEDKVKMLLMPRGGTTYLTNFSFPVIELQRWQVWEKNGLRITAVPVDHVGFRYGADDAWMKHAFTGYVFEYHDLKVYFGGDSAYNQRMFVETSQRFPNLDVALLPIGPIEPRSFMREMHMDPREAVQAFIDLDALTMVPIHYGTFVNSTDDPGDALRELEAARKTTNLGTHEIVPVKIGEQRVFLKQGEKAKHTKPEYKPPPPPPPPPTNQPKQEEKKDDIPDDEKLD